jgi:hypothetical protein
MVQMFVIHLNENMDVYEKSLFGSLTMFQKLQCVIPDLRVAKPNGLASILFFMFIVVAVLSALHG